MFYLSYDPFHLIWLNGKEAENFSIINESYFVLDLPFFIKKYLCLKMTCCVMAK